MYLLPSKINFFIVVLFLVVACSEDSTAPEIRDTTSYKLTFMARANAGDRFQPIVLDSKNSIQRTLDNDGFFDEVYFPRFSPDGTELLLIAAINQTGGRHVYIADVDGSTYTQIPNTEWAYYARWSPDGSQILYLGSPIGDFANADFIVVDRTTLARQILNKGNNTLNLNNDIIWSQDGERIFFSAKENTDYYHIYQYSFAGDSTVKLVESTGSHFNLWLSQDNKTLLYLQRTQVSPGVFNSWLMRLDLDGSAPDTLLASKESFLLSNPKFSPDESWLYFVSGVAGNSNASELFRMRPDDSEMSQLTSLGGTIFGFAWKPDGSGLAFIVKDGDALAQEHVYFMPTGGSSAEKLNDLYTIRELHWARETTQEFE